MWPSTSCPLSNFTRNIVFGRASVTSPSISILSSFAKLLLDLLYVDGLRPLVAVLFLIGHLAGLLQRLEAVAVDAGVMHEQIAAAVVGRDESIALFVVEPLDGPGCHSCCTFQ